jgi:FKBP-type peptidyl-prolyl cis-trans isomerase
MKNIKSIVLVIIIIVLTISCSDRSKRGSKIALNNELDSASFAFGLSFANSLKYSNYVDRLNIDAVTAAIRSVYGNDKDTVLTREEVTYILNNYFRKTREERMRRNLDEGELFLSKNKKNKGVIVTESGLQYKILKEGTGRTPTLNDKVRCNYRGMLINGKEFDSSYKRGEPAEFSVKGVIKGWQEALQLMKEGAKWELYIPTNLAYGPRVRPGTLLEPNMALIFEIELLEIVEPEEKKE